MKRRRVLQLLLSFPFLPRSLSSLASPFFGDVYTTRLPDFEIVDPDILCDLAVKCVGLKLQQHFGTLRLVREKAEGEAYLVLITPPQHLYEEAFYESIATEPPPDIGHVRGVFANRSKVVLEVRPDVHFIPFNQDALLDWGRYFQTVFPPARGIPTSSIEVPAGLLIAVDNDSKWDTGHVYKSAAAGSVKAQQWYARRIPNSPNQRQFKLRPFETVEIRFRDVGGTAPTCPGPAGEFVSSLSKNDREEIVKTFSGEAGMCASPDLPLADTLLLTSSGATLSVVAKHPDQKYGCLIDAWTQRIANGRDTYTRVEIPGCHYPYGIKCTLLKITERRMQPDRNGIVGAYLRQEYVLQRVPNATVKQDFLDMPFVDLSMTTERTPPLDIESQPPCDEPLLKGVLDPRYPLLFRPHVGGTPLRMSFSGHDKIETEQPDLEASSIFVPYKYIDRNTGRLPDELQKIVDGAWQADSARALRRIYLAGRRIALARESRPGDTQLSTQEIELVRASDVPVDPHSQISPIPFWSRMYRAKVEPQALTTMSGQPKSIDITIRKTADKTIDQERADPPSTSFDPEQSDTGVFCRLVQPEPSDFAAGGTNRVGGVATPNIRISGLSRKTGLASNSELSALQFTQASRGNLSIGSIFEGVDGKFLGGLHLSDIFRLITATSVGELPALSYEFSSGDPLADPKAVLQAIANPIALQYPNADVVAFPAQLKAQLKWRYDWAADASPVLIFRPQRKPGENLPANPATLFLDAQIGVDLRGAQPLVSATGRLTDFEIAFPSATSADLAWITVPFESVEFEVSGNSKPHFRPVVGEIRFGGEFKFIADIAERLKNLGRYKVLIDVDSQGVGVRHSLTIDPIKIGAIQISNLSLVYGIRLPFDGSQMLLDVGLATRDDPFTVSVSGYAGAGFFRTLLGAAGPLALEVSLEFGGNYEANFGGIAHGKAYLMAGLYYGLFDRGGSRDTVLEGYVRAGGNLDVLKIGSVSVVVFLSLRFQNGGAQGSVTVTVTVKIALIEISQHFEAHQRYGGSSSAFAFLPSELEVSRAGADPPTGRDSAGRSFGDTYSKSDWHQYWAAFA